MINKKRRKLENPTTPTVHSNKTDTTPIKPSDESEWTAEMNKARDEMWMSTKEETCDDMPNAATTGRVCMCTCVSMYLVADDTSCMCLGHNIPVK